MSAENERRTPKFEVVAFLPFFGPPPIFRSENIVHYEGMRDQLIGCFAPNDFFELNLVMEMVNDAWQTKRGTWHKALAVERWSQKSLEFQAKRLELQQSRQDKEAIGHGIRAKRSKSGAVSFDLLKGGEGSSHAAV